MSVTTPAVQLTTTQGAQLPPPQSGSGTLAAVVIANLSPYVLTLTIGPNQVYLQPWTENLYSLGTANSVPVGVSAASPPGTTVPAGSSAQVTATWYQPQEIPQGAWPVSLTANAIAAAIAAAVQATITNPTAVATTNYVETAIATQTIAAAGLGAALSTTGYASIIVSNPGASRVPGYQLSYQFFDPNGNASGQGEFGVPADPQGIGFSLPAYLIPVRGSSVQFRNNSGGPVTLFIVGANKPEARPRPADDQNPIRNLSVSASFVTATTYVLSGVVNQTGLCYIEFIVTGAAITGSLSLTDQDGNVFDLVDSTETHTNPATNRVVTKQVVLPSVPTIAQFSCTGGGVGTVLLRIMGNL